MLALNSLYPPHPLIYVGITCNVEDVGDSCVYNIIHTRVPYQSGHNILPNQPSLGIYEPERKTYGARVHVCVCVCVCVHRSKQRVHKRTSAKLKWLHQLFITTYVYGYYRFSYEGRGARNNLRASTLYMYISKIPWGSMHPEPP